MTGSHASSKRKVPFADIVGRAVGLWISYALLAVLAVYLGGGHTRDFTPNEHLQEQR